ncbi:hypothetical protein TIFTF001_025408 [Ficus carica]|uniref:Histidine-containing phosphotransfer protein n=1 Tax=Ficus carica TaxID=3494 RepID=A0AA88DFI8_FICCA|nr:hypothetical protein TIFTF001_025408 [Ficus carica]
MKMVGISLVQLVNNFIRNLYDEGILDRNFNCLERISNTQSNNPMSISQIINSYFNEAEESIANLTKHMSETIIIYAQVKDAANHLKCCSSRIGGFRVVQACQELGRACDDDDNKDRCLESFEKLIDEYGSLHENLTRICAVILT